MDKPLSAVNRDRRWRAGIALGSVIAGLFALAVTAAGVWLLVGDKFRAPAADDVRAWRRVPCAITSSSVVQSGPVKSAKYLARVTFLYTVNGRTYRSGALSPGDTGFDDYYRAAKEIEKYPAGSTRAALVNPADAGVAYLEPASRTAAIVGGWVLVGIGVFLLQGVIRAARNPDWNSRVGRSKNAPAVLFLSLFIAIGLGTAVFIFIPGVIRAIKAQSWAMVACRVVDADVVTSHSDKGGDTYRVAALFRYEFNGEEHESSRYKLMDNSSSGGYSGKWDVVQALRDKPSTTCYVDPADPDDAVLDRSMTEPALWLLFPLAFAGLPGWMMYMTVRKGRQGTPGSMRSRSVTTDVVGAHYVTHRSPGLSPMGSRAGFAAADGSSHVLRSDQGPVTGLVVLLIISLFWNGITWFMVYQAYQSMPKHTVSGAFGWVDLLFSGFQAIFMIPFVLIGLVLIFVTILQGMTLFNPRVKVTLDGMPAVLGGKARIKWELSGRADRVRRLIITCEGHEIAKHMEGSGESRGLHTTERVFRTIDIVDTTQPMSIPSGQAEFAIPADTMHSFKSDHNAIAWTIHIKGEIHHWANLDQKMTIEVGTGSVVGG